MAIGGRLFPLAALLSLGLSLSAASGQEGPDSGPKKQEEREKAHGMMGGMGMMQMMHQCMEHCRAVQEPAKDLKKKVEEARASGDPARMKQVLEDVEQYLTETESRMSRCMKMMGGQGMMERPKRGKEESK